MAAPSEFFFRAAPCVTTVPPPTFSEIGASNDSSMLLASVRKGTEGCGGAICEPPPRRTPYDMSGGDMRRGGFVVMLPLSHV